MNPRTASLSLLLLWSTQCVQASDGSAAAVRSDLHEGNLLMDENRPLQVKPKTTVDVLVGNAAELHCRSESGEGLATWWQTPFGSFGGAMFRENDPIAINNGTLRILRATSSHTGLYHCHLVDSSETTVIPYTVKVVDRARPRMTREAEASTTPLVQGVVPSVVVTFVVAFTLGAFSRPYVIKCLHRTRARMVRKRELQKRAGGRGLFTLTTNNSSSLFENPAAPKTSTTVKWSKSQSESVHMEGGAEVEDEADGAEDGQKEEEAHIQSKRRSRVIKLYNYDEEGKRYNHVTEPGEVVEEREPGPRHRVMSLTRLNAIMSQAETLEVAASRKSADSSSSAVADDPPQIETVTE